LISLVRAIKFAREGAAVKRCHTIQFIGNYDVGGHSFNMLAMLRIWKPDASLNLVWAIIEHDAPERSTGDVPAPAKWAGIIDKDELNLVEMEITTRIFGDDSCQKLTLEELSWLKALDILELYLWCRDQVELGNRNALSMMARIEKFINKNKASWPKEFNEQWGEFMFADWTPVPELGDDE